MNTIDSLWVTMMRGVRDRNSTACTEWTNKQTFIEWAADKYVDGYVLDCRLITGDSTMHHSPDTCLIVPRPIKHMTSSVAFKVFNSSDEYKSNISPELLKIHLNKLSDNVFKLSKRFPEFIKYLEKYGDTSVLGNHAFKYIPLVDGESGSSPFDKRFINDSPYKVEYTVCDEVVYCPAYLLWISLIKKCHSFHNEKRTKFNMSNDWKRFDSFRVWYDENYVDGYVLNLKLISRTNNTYAADKCLFVPVKLDKLLKKEFANMRLRRGCLKRAAEHFPDFRKYLTKTKENDEMNKLHGIGIIGSNEDSESKDVWTEMFDICYGSKSLLRVSPKWHKHANFKKWYNKNYVDGWVLNYHLNDDGSNIYSPDTCMFVPYGVNLVSSGEFVVNYPHEVGKVYTTRMITGNIKQRYTHYEAREHYVRCFNSELERLTALYPMFTKQLKKLTLYR